jgi:hypothetical protein
MLDSTIGSIDVGRLEIMNDMISNMKSEDIESVLVPEALKTLLKVIFVFLAASIPIVISIITLLLTRISQ